MADELAERIAEAKKAMFGTQPPSGGKVLLLVKGQAKVTCSDPKVEVRPA